MTQSEKQAFVRLAYSAYVWRVPSVDELNFWAAQITDDGSNVDGVLTNIEDGAEGTAVSAARANLLAWAAAGKFPGSATATHKHDVSSTTGPPK